ncbi:hypothetical protein RI129_006294 [Pyrocoelia pectoralis]|uniref:Protein kinase domain-containing protein n=1 Tax=Pyrocoelia pectoralis TaxID=417401 RepID=A0AAN7VF18_9COLE
MRLACKIFDKEKAATDFLEKFFPRELEILGLKCENIINFKKVQYEPCGFRIWLILCCLTSTYPQYAAAEVVSGTPYNPKLSDVWSLGIILFIILKSILFDDSNFRKLLKDQMTRNWVFRSRIRDTISPTAKSIVPTTYFRT